MALSSDCELIQVTTWNDYGEGTMIEPTKEFEYQYLEKIQRLYQKDENFAFSSNDLRLPINLYQLRKHYKDNEKISLQINQASKLLFDSKTNEAGKILKRYSHN